MRWKLVQTIMKWISDVHIEIVFFGAHKLQSWCFNKCDKFYPCAHHVGAQAALLHCFQYICGSAHAVQIQLSENKNPFPFFNPN